MALPGTKHKVIGLVSGGKDSCFNLMHAVANGHEIVALATLTPEQGIEELDSHMYQSVGTELPPLIAQAMGLPHYSGIIRGKPVEQGMEYGSRERGGEGSGKDGDETEDLTALLRTVRAAHPEATAVSSGAILSNYQRLRIEHVCQRLGLTSLSYIWQSEQLPLVTRMISSGLDAILVKVAGIGLKEAHVGKSLAQLLPLLTRLYGAHPAGEGGEYETLTLDTPLFSHRIRIVESEVVVSDPEPNLVAYLRVQKAELEPKDGWVRPSVSELRDLLGLDEDVEEGADGLDEAGLEVFDQIKDAEVEERRDMDPEECDSHENSMEIPDLDIDGGDTPTATQNGHGESVKDDSDSDGGKRPTRGLRPMSSSTRRMLGGKGMPRKGPKLPDAKSSPPTDDMDLSDDDKEAFTMPPPPGLSLSLPGAVQEEESPHALRFVQRGRWFVVSASGPGEGDVAYELRAAFDAVKDRLASAGLSLPLHAAHVTLLLASMAEFAAANAAYIQYFGSSPPSRACVGAHLPSPQRIRVEVVGFDSRPQGGREVGARTALHVQGLSYWAPANIGPYSQAVTVDARVHVAGQIPLQPASLALAPYPSSRSPYAHQAALALQHARRIVEVLRSPTSSGGGWDGWIESCIAWWARPKGCGAEGPAVAQRAWTAWAKENGCAKAPVLFARAAELPRGALVEFQLNAHTGRPGCNAAPADSDDEEMQEVEYRDGELFPGTYREQAVARGGARGARSVVFFETALALSMPYLIKNLLSHGDDSAPLALRVYHRGDLPTGVAKVAAALGAAWTAVPVLDVQDRHGVSYPLAFDVLLV